MEPVMARPKYFEMKCVYSAINLLSMTKPFDFAVQNVIAVFKASHATY